MEGNFYSYSGAHYTWRREKIAQMTGSNYKENNSGDDEMGANDGLAGAVVWA